MRAWCSRAWTQRPLGHPPLPSQLRSCARGGASKAAATMPAADTQPAALAGGVMTYAPETSWEPEVQSYLEACLGEEELQRINEALTRPPLATCLRVNTLRVTPQELLDRLPGAMSSEDQALVEANPRKPYIHPQLPGAIIVPGTGPHAIDYSCTGGKEVIVGRLAGEAIMRGAHLFAPGLLAVSAGISRGDLVAVAVGVEVSGSQTSSKWGMTKGTVLGVDPEKDAQHPDRSRLYIGVGRAEMSRVEFFRSTAGLAVTMQERVFRTPGCGYILRGQFMLQNLPSLLAAHVLAPRPGARVLDMCAAPGGKTTALAQLMEDRGEVIAFDRTHAKAREVRQLAEELGITCVKAFKMDATRAVLRRARWGLTQSSGGGGSGSGGVGGATDTAAGAAGPSGREDGSGAAGPAAAAAAAGGSSGSNAGAAAVSEKTLKRIERIAAARRARGQDPGIFPELPECKEATVEGYDPETFDYVLLDAPCSALGLRPRLVHRQTLRELEGTAAYQRKLIDVAVQLIKPGGYLVFSTCTFNPGENEANVRYLLDTYPFMRLVPQSPRLGGPGLVGEVALPGGGTLRLLTPAEAELVQRFSPADQLDTIGFFISKFEKVESCLPAAEAAAGAPEAAV